MEEDEKFPEVQKQVQREKNVNNVIVGESRKGVVASPETPFVTQSPRLLDYSVAQDGKGKLSKEKTGRSIAHMPSHGEHGRTQQEQKAQLRNSNMVEEHGIGAIQNFARRSPPSKGPVPLSSYLILSPSSPARIFAIFALTHWVYPTVIIVMICAFVISSVYYRIFVERGDLDQVPIGLQCVRWMLLTTLAFEIVIKSIARGLLIVKTAYLRIPWDWLDIFSFLLVFVSIVVSCEPVEFVAAAVVALRLIPFQTGSISAFIFLCSCAKKLIPVLLYGVIIVWSYSVAIFTLFVKYHQLDYQDGGDSANDTKSEELTSDNGTENMRGKINVHSPAGTTFPQNMSDQGLSMECLPTNFRSLSGSFVQTMQMITLRYTNVAIPPNQGLLSSSIYSCQYELFTLSFLEKLVIITGTLPVISMSFAVLYHFFQTSKLRPDAPKPEQNHYAGDNQNRHSHRRRTVNSLRSTNSSNNDHEQHYQSQEKVGKCKICCGEVAAALFNWDYYFCCLANLQRQLSPYSSRLFTWRGFTFFVCFVVLTDLLATIVILCGSGFDSDALYLRLLSYYIQGCFVFYTLEAVFKWFAVSSEEYWVNCWSAFDLTIVIVYWIGYGVIEYRSYHWFYLKFCRILMLRVLKVVPYWATLDRMLKLCFDSVRGIKHLLFVIVICSVSVVLLKQSTIFLEYFEFAEDPFLKELLSTLSESAFVLTVAVFVLVLFVGVFVKSGEVLQSQRESSTARNPTISLLLNNSNSSDIPIQGETYSSRSFIDSSPIVEHSLPNGINFHNNITYRNSLDTNGLLSHETRSILSPSTDVLSPLLSVPNGFASHPLTPTEECSPRPENLHLGVAHDRFLSNNNSGCLDSSSSISVDDALNISSVFMILLSSVNISLDFSGNEVSQMNWFSLLPGSSLWIETLFILCVGSHVFYRIRLKRFARDTFLQICSVTDMIIILAAAAELFSSGMTWVKFKKRPQSLQLFMDSAKIVSACRGLLVLSRISWLQCVASRLCYEVWKLSKYLAAFGYTWLIFIITCSEGQKILNQMANGNSQSYNGTPEEISVKPENISNTSNATDPELVPAIDNFSVHPVAVTLTILLLLINTGIVLGMARFSSGDFTQLLEKFMTPKQLAQYRHKVCVTQLADVEPDHEATPYKGLCVPMSYYVTNHRIFDFVMMTVIFFDALGITFEYFATSERAFILRRHYPAYMLFWYGSELLTKIIGNGLNFFNSYWNLFDISLLAIGFIDFCASNFYRSWTISVLQNLRFLRILRFFQFYPYIHRADVVAALLVVFQKIFYVSMNFMGFCVCVYGAEIVYRLRCSYTSYSCFVELHGKSLVASPEPHSTVSFAFVDTRRVLEWLGKSITVPSFRCILYAAGLLIYWLTVTFLAFIICLLIVGALCRQLGEGEGNQKEIRSHELLYLDNKSSYLNPCISPETVDIETSSSAGTSSRLNNMSRCEIDQNPVYEESNGCKVFFVEAMITTV